MVPVTLTHPVWIRGGEFQESHLYRGGLSNIMRPHYVSSFSVAICVCFLILTSRLKKMSSELGSESCLSQCRPCASQSVSSSAQQGSVRHVVNSQEMSQVHTHTHTAMYITDLL